MNYKDVRVLLLGCGNWGKTHLKTLQALTNNYLVHDICYDKYPGWLPIEKTWDGDPNKVDAVIVATTSSTHFELTKKWLELGKHILVEKPVVKNKEELGELNDIAAKSRGVLMAGHTMVYSGAMPSIRFNKDNNEPIVVIMRRMKKNPIVGDDEVYRLIPHDLSILFHVFEDKKIKVKNNLGTNFVLDIEGTGVADVIVSWHQDPAIRDMYVFQKNELTTYFNDANNLLLNGRYQIPFDVTPPLIKEQLAFLNSCVGRNENLTGIDHINKVYELLTDMKKWEPWDGKTT